MNLLNGDCLELLKTIPDQSVDMVLADLPYGTTACKWDIIIPFEPLWSELHRVCKPNAAMCMFGQEPFSSKLRTSNINNFKYDWFWEKNKKTGFVNAKLKPLKKIEKCSVFSMGKTSNNSKNNMPYFPQGLARIDKVVKDPRAAKSMSERVENSSVRPCWKPERVQEFTNYPSEILKFKHEEKQVHPTQKPVALLEYLIKTYTNEGETVLDPTMGSGSTGVACKNLNRKFIGIEKDPQYFEIAEKRIFNAFPLFEKQVHGPRTTE